MSERLKAETCIECQAAIKVAEYTPHPLEEQATGMAAQVWRGGGLGTPQQHFIGWICNRCAFTRALTKGGGGGVGGCGSSMDFTYDEYPPPPMPVSEEAPDA